MRWLAECSVAAVRAALAALAPELAGAPITLPAKASGGDPLWHSGAARLGTRHVVKFAWSAPAARRLAHEIAVLDALHRAGLAAP